VFAYQKSLLNEHLLCEKFSNLRVIWLVACRKITDYRFINKLLKLEKIYLCYIPKLVIFPRFEALKNVEYISLVGTNNLQNIDNILIHDNLSELKISDITKIPVLEFHKFKKLKHLKMLNAIFMRVKAAREFDELVAKNR